MNVNRFCQIDCKLSPTLLQRKIRASGNSGFKNLAVQWSNEVQFSNKSFVQVDNFLLRNRQLLKPAKRYSSCLGVSTNLKREQRKYIYYI